MPNKARRYIYIMKKIIAVFLSLCMLVCCAFAQADETETFCIYTIFNETGATVTELYLQDNATGEMGENYAGDEGISNEGCIVINCDNKENYLVSLIFKTDNGQEGTFPTLHFENVDITLLSEDTIAENIAAVADDPNKTDAVTGATVISFKAPVCSYYVYNMTGEKLVELFLVRNTVNEVTDNLAGLDGIEPGEMVEVNGTKVPDYEATLSFKTESGYANSFDTLKFETVPITLLPQADVTTGATPISFTEPAE